MIFYPAIDLKDGNCVRLLRGDMDQATVFNNDAGAQAKEFAKSGADWIHVVDLNGAFAGKPINEKAVEAIINASDCSVQLGGGIRNLDQVGKWLDKGLSRVILGTVAVKNPQVVRDACREYPNKIVVGIDALNDLVAVEGWAQATEISALELAKRFEDIGVAAIIFTDIDRDGAMAGVNVDATAELARQISIPVIASGGVSSLDDLKILCKYPEISGVISGRALYDGQIDLGDALDICKKHETKNQINRN